MSLTGGTLTTLFPVPPALPTAAAAQSTRATCRPPRFLVPQEPVYLGLWESVRALCKWTKPPTSARATRIFREAFVTKVELGRSRLLLSFLLHSLLVLSVPNPQLILSGSDAEQSSAYYRRKAIVYRMPLMAPPTKTLPRVAPVGPGGRPGSGSAADRPPALGRIGSAGRRTVIYKPLHPDNIRQTIRQLDSPRDLQIAQEIKAPDIIFGNLHEPQRPILHLEVKNAKPIVGTRQAGSGAVPAPDLAVSITSQTTLQLVDDRPHLPVEALAASKPVLKRGTGESGASIPDDAGFPGTGNGLVVLSVNPGLSTSQPALPPGNREGEFALSPAGGRNGSPGGAPDGVVGGGDANSEGNTGNTGGDGSTGLGPGNGGGGGGRSADTGSLTINGTRGAVASVGVLRSNFIASLVYPVDRALLPPRKSQLVVSAGPMGGGGLNVYGALHCGKIYTIFLEMPGKSWTLQFCEHSGKKENTVSQNRSSIVHLEEGLIAPYAEAKFDFRRLPVPEKDSRKLIVLKGVLEEDGTVDKLEIYQGLLFEMDEAARLALGRWKFKPATRAKVPVAVDILVGIPAQIPR